MNLPHRQAWGLGCSNCHLGVVGFVNRCLLVAVAVVVALLATAILVVTEQAAIIVVEQGVAVTELLVIVVVIKRQLKSAIISPIHHQNLYQISNWLQAPHFCHKQNKLLRPCVWGNLAMSVYLLHPSLPVTL